MGRSWRSWAKTWRRDLLLLTIEALAFSLAAACLVAFKLRDNRGGTWAENALTALSVLVPLAVVFGAVMCWWAFVEDRGPFGKPRDR